MCLVRFCLGNISSYMQTSGYIQLHPIFCVKAKNNKHSGCAPWDRDRVKRDREPPTHHRDVTVVANRADCCQFSLLLASPPPLKRFAGMLPDRLRMSFVAPIGFYLCVYKVYLNGIQMWSRFFMLLSRLLVICRG